MKKDTTLFRERFNRWKAGEKVYEAGLPVYKDGKEGLIVNDSQYREWESGLASNLQNETISYDLRGAYNAGLQQHLENDGYYHLGSRDPKTNRILKRPFHPTYLTALAADLNEGYVPVIDKNGETYTYPGWGITWQDRMKKHEFDLPSYQNGRNSLLKTLSNLFNIITSTDELKRRLGWAESAFDSNAVSSAGAKGTYLIMDSVLVDYNRANKTNYQPNDLFNEKVNSKVRDWTMDRLHKSGVINAKKSTPGMAIIKQLAAYNYGPKNLSNLLVKLRDSGTDIYSEAGLLTLLDSLPTETRNYVSFIGLGRDSGGHRTNAAYNKHFGIITPTDIVQTQLKIILPDRILSTSYNIPAVSTAISPIINKSTISRYNDPSTPASLSWSNSYPTQQDIIMNAIKAQDQYRTMSKSLSIPTLMDAQIQMLQELWEK